MCLQEGKTALHFAVEEGKLPVLKMLLDANAKVDVQDKVTWDLVVCMRSIVALSVNPNPIPFT